ncbi:hypothetical protein LZ32DRAFT_610014 [Colletotrichum eremochloae]|nr:hypothetical protein LZ32DRAFT_610014 [Colletotrichum eremochloae]
MNAFLGWFSTAFSFFLFFSLFFFCCCPQSYAGLVMDFGDWLRAPVRKKLWLGSLEKLLNYV